MRWISALPFLLVLLFAACGGPTQEVCVLETSMGTMTFRFFEADAPNTSAHIKALVRQGYYDGLPFFRVVKGHVIQAGDSSATVDAEFNSRPHLEGTVGLARSEDPNSGAASFYICLVPRPHLDGRYTVFGQLVEGLDVLRAIGAVEVEEKYLGEARIAFHEPKTPVLIHKATVQRRRLPSEADKRGSQG